MSVFSDAMATLAASALAETATYRPAGQGAGTSVAVLRADVEPEASFGRTRSTRHTTMLEVLVTAVATPARGDTFTVGAQVWKVADPPILDPVSGSWTMACFLDVAE